jgi:hypothetical protein
MATDPRTRRRWLILAALGTAHLAVLFVGPMVTAEAGLIPIHDWTIASLAVFLIGRWRLPSSVSGSANTAPLREILSPVRDWLGW